MSVGNTVSTVAGTLNDGLVGHWTFDGPDVDWSSTTAEIKDISLSANDANAGGMSVASAGRGVVGQAIDFDGVDDYVSMPSAPNVSPNGSYSLSLWAFVGSYVNGSSGSGDGTYLIDRTSGTNGLSSLKISNDKYCFQKRYDSLTGLGCVSSVGNVELNTWTHIVMIRDYNNQFSIYRDGAFQASTTDSGSNALTFPAVKMGAHFNTLFFNGSLDDVRIYNRALTPDEISQLYAMGEGVKVAKTVVPPSSSLDSGLLGHWTFDGPDVDWSSTTAEVRDSSGSGNNGDARNGMSTASAVPGAVGQALRFNSASGNYLQYGNILNSLAFPFSISSWVYRDGSTSDYIVATDDQDVPAGILCGAWIAIGSNQAQANTGDCVCNALNCKKTATTVSTVPTKEWVNIVAVFNSLGDSDIYFNGALQSVTYTGTATAFNQSSLSFKIGRSGRSPTADMDGMIDDVRIYNRALSATEIQQLYSMGR